MKLRKNTTTIVAAVGDLTQQDTDAIVNAANRSLVGGGGVDGAVHSRGGPSIMKELDVIRKERGGCPTGEAVITSAGKLPARFVIHTVGPIYSGGAQDAALLANCYRNSLRLAYEHKLKTIAFCSISTGVYRYPIEQAAAIAINTVLAEAAQYDFTEIRFILFSDRDYQVYKKLLANLGGLD